MRFKPKANINIQVSIQIPYNLVFVKKTTNCCQYEENTVDFMFYKDIRCTYVSFPEKCLQM